MNKFSRVMASTVLMSVLSGCGSKIDIFNKGEEEENSASFAGAGAPGARSHAALDPEKTGNGLVVIAPSFWDWILKELGNGVGSLPQRPSESSISNQDTTANNSTLPKSDLNDSSGLITKAYTPTDEGGLVTEPYAPTDENAASGVILALQGKTEGDSGCTSEEYSDRELHDPSGSSLATPKCGATIVALALLTKFVEIFGVDRIHGIERYFIHWLERIVHTVADENFQWMDILPAIDGICKNLGSDNALCGYQPTKRDPVEVGEQVLKAWLAKADSAKLQSDINVVLKKLVEGYPDFSKIMERIKQR